MMRRYITIAVLFSATLQVTRAQINPSASQYFYNRMFQNVGATGMEKGIRLDASFRSMTPNSFDGSPVNTMVSLQGGVGERAGAGIQFQQERAGLLSRSRVYGSYAIDLSQGDTRIRLGVGLGMLSTRVVTGGSVQVRGDANDPLIAAFNNGKMRLDGSIGGLIEKNGWEILASVPSLGMIQEFRGYNSIDYTVLNSMVSKKVVVAEDEKGKVTLQPMLGYRMLQGVSDVLDLGARLNYKEDLQFLAIYHSNREVALGLAVPFKEKLLLSFTYNAGRAYSKQYLNVGGTIEAYVMYKF